MPFFRRLRRKKQWQPVGEFPTASVQRLPFQRPDDEGNKIIYTTRYEPQSPEKCGIFEYNFVTKENRAIRLWADADYFPRWDVSVYNESEDSILFVGGANVQNRHKRYEILLTYNLSDDSITRVHFPSIIGGNARICLSDHDRYLHVIGGTSNYHHIMYDLRRGEMYYMYSFYHSYPQIQSCGLLHSPLANKLFMFGGRSSFQHSRRPQPQRMSFDDFWTLDLNSKFAKLSMKDCSWLLVNGWIAEQMYSKEDGQCFADYPIELNDVVLKFLGIGNTVHIWKKSERWSLPKPMYQFGAVLYRDRVIITFGGRDESNETIDDIFYLDLLDAAGGWKASKLKCPRPSTYNAAIVDASTVHIVPFYVHKDHYSIPIKRLLPSKLVDQINLDMSSAEEDEQLSGGEHEFSTEYRNMMRLQHRHWRNRMALSVAIGLLLVAIGLILFLVAPVAAVGVGVVCFGATVIAAAVLWRLRHRPSQAEYLLF